MESYYKMKTINLKYILSIGLLLLFASCFNDDFDDHIRDSSILENQNFVYQGLKNFYLYKANKEVLADDYFSDQEDLKSFLQIYSSPESLFDDLLFHEDRFSIIVPDFRELEKSLAGIRKTNGMSIGLAKLSSSGKVFGYVRYVLPNSSAENQAVERGMLFNRIDGIELDENNYIDLLAPEVYQISLAKLENNELISLEQSISLQKAELAENPILMSSVLNIGNHKVGYLMYNGFTRSYNDELNQVFGEFSSEGITDLVLDLRYNNGGSIETSQALAGMITGQFSGQLFVKEVYNVNFQDQDLLFSNNMANMSLNNLYLDKLYVLTSKSTASASELLINGLNPYIDVVQIGDYTTGKFQGSITLYDSPNFSRSAVKPGHNYAMQPLILKTINALGNTDYHDGLPPTIDQKEDLSNLGILGNPDEKLLGLALEQITGQALLPTESKQKEVLDYIQLPENQLNDKLFQKMYKDNIPKF